jgi:hypothetical protein
MLLNFRYAKIWDSVSLAESQILQLIAAINHKDFDLAKILVTVISCKGFCEVTCIDQ